MHMKDLLVITLLLNSGVSGRVANTVFAQSSAVRLRMGDLGGLTSQLTSSSFGRDVKLGVPCLDAACTVGLNHFSVARNLDKPTQNKLKTKKQWLSRIKQVLFRFKSFIRERNWQGTSAKFDSSHTLSLNSS